MTASIHQGSLTYSEHFESRNEADIGMGFEEICCIEEWRKMRGDKCWKRVLWPGGLRQPSRPQVSTLFPFLAQR